MQTHAVTQHSVQSFFDLTLTLFILLSEEMSYHHYQPPTAYPIPANTPIPLILTLSPAVLPIGNFSCQSLC